MLTHCVRFWQILAISPATVRNELINLETAEKQGEIREKPSVVSAHVTYTYLINQSIIYFNYP